MHFAEPKLLHLSNLGAESAATAAVAMAGLDHRDNLVVAATATEVDWLPQIALAARANGWKIVGYVLLDAAPGGAHADWPDAPVVVITGDEAKAKAALLRGWHRLTAASDESTGLEAAIAWIDSGS